MARGHPVTLKRSVSASPSARSTCGSTKVPPTSAARPPAPRRAPPTTSATAAAAATPSRGRRHRPGGGPPAAASGWRSAWPRPSGALQRDRLDEARRIVTPLLREVPGVAAVHEVAGLVNYRLGRWRDAVRELEAAQALAPRVDLLPVLADSYRALKRWSDVDRIWTTVREISPAHDVLAEARIVAAGAQADRGDLAGALRDDGEGPGAAEACPSPPPASSGTCSATCTIAPVTRSRRRGGSSVSPASIPTSSTSALASARSAAEAPSGPARSLPTGGHPTLPRQRGGRDRAGRRRHPRLRACRCTWQLAAAPGRHRAGGGGRSTRCGARSRRRPVSALPTSMSVGEHPEWVAYEWPAEIRAGRRGIGQVQRWFTFRVVDDDVCRGPTAASSPRGDGSTAAG